ncbi:MAG: hypothetical protein JWO83_690, partial [Caulobacteraceae bacterium]|nr:hypothetical protein [Caulobacteraceae bacterium]
PAPRAANPAAPGPIVTPPAAPPPSADNAARPGPVGSAGRCGEATALTCLPRSSAPVVFADPGAANRAASQDIRDGLSTTQAQADAIRDGASGKASRLCGILGSNDSSALGKHLAALRLNNPQPNDGQPTAACMKLAGNFL